MSTRDLNVRGRMIIITAAAAAADRHGPGNERRRARDSRLPGCAAQLDDTCRYCGRSTTNTIAYQARLREVRGYGFKLLIILFEN